MKKKKKKCVAWYLVVFLQFAGPVNVFLFYNHNPCKHNKAKKYQDVYHISSLTLKHSQKKMNNILQFSEYKNL